MGRLDGKTAIITGAARGQGADEALLFALEGASVVFGDVLDEEGRAVERPYQGAGRRSDLCKPRCYERRRLGFRQSATPRSSTAVSTYS